MKLLSSDYDGTLNAFGCSLFINLPFIKRLREDGHIFVLNTGRSFDSIKSKIVKYHIPYDYLSCNDGNLLLNSNDEVIYSTNMDNDISIVLGELKKKFPHIKLKPMIYDNKILEYQIIISKMDKEFFLELNRICGLYNLCYKTFHIANQRYLYICDNKISKSTAINKIVELENIFNCDIFTVGDDLNDYEMIRDFNGYTFPWGKKELKSVSLGICGSVASLVKKMTK